MTGRHRVRHAAFAVVASALLVGTLIGQTAGTALADDHGNGRHDGAQMFVAPTASAANRGRSCETARYSTIQAAIDAAPSGATVVVCKGTYVEQVVLGKPIVLTGRDATIDEKGVTPSFVANVPGVGSLPIFAGVVIVGSHVTVSGFTITDAQGEGVLAAGITAPLVDVSLAGNRVVNNDLGGGVPPASPYFECQASGEIPGDCGEGVHFIAVAYSDISHNYIAGNSGGVLLTDETGPTHDNLIEGNQVTNNQSDCGITVPGHNPDALDANGKRQPAVAGVYRNVIKGNSITNNGHLGEGAGVLFANASGGTGSYDNLVEGNYIAGNQLAGVTMHAHLLDPSDPNSAKGEDLNGNRIVGNVIGTNNVPGQFVQGDELDGVVTVTQTTGILVWAGPVKVRVSIANNRISDNHFGIWLGLKANVEASIEDNSFRHVDVPVFVFG
jgi:nitrous oxidase accessory protein NosD